MKLFNFRTLVAYEGAHRRCCLNIGIAASGAEEITMSIFSTTLLLFGLDKQLSTLVLIINIY